MSTPTFADDQAEKTGVDARTVRRQAERGEKVSPAALAMVKGRASTPGRNCILIGTPAHAFMSASAREDFE